MAVGAVGVPVKAGLAKFAFNANPSNTALLLTALIDPSTMVWSTLVGEGISDNKAIVPELFGTISFTSERLVNNSVLITTGGLVSDAKAK